MKKRGNGVRNGFTIVELIVVIVVIAILAAMVTVSYVAITRDTVETTMKADLSTAASQVQEYRQLKGTYPATAGELNNGAGLQASENNTLSYVKGSDRFCVAITSTSTDVTYYYDSSTKETREGQCPSVAAGAAPLIQTITTATCPKVLTMAVDARDRLTYWVKKLPDGRCWMLTNLAYTGGTSNGGVASYGDVKTLENGTSATTATYTSPQYYTPPGAKWTVDPEKPSMSANGGDSGQQYGQLYNWCGATGGQTGTGGCSNTIATAPDPNISICPAGWRLPTGMSGTGEFTKLNAAINNGDASSPSGLFAEWMAQNAGYWWRDGFHNQGRASYYWSSTQASLTDAYYLRAYDYEFHLVIPDDTTPKVHGRPVRCIAV